MKTNGFQGFDGGDKRDRTADLLNAIQALSQLSYTPIFGSLSDSFCIIACQRKMSSIFFRKLRTGSQFCEPVGWFSGGIAALGGGEVGGQQQGADDGGGHGIGDAGGKALLEDAVHALVVEQDLQHRRDAGPADHTGGHLGEVEPDQQFPVAAVGTQVGHIGQHTQQAAEGSAGDDPAPAQLARMQVDADVTQQSRQGTGQRAADHGQKCQQAVLHADVDGIDGAGEGHEGTQQKEQNRSGGDDAQPFRCDVFHKNLLRW